jgi:hypothetical protein
MECSKREILYFLTENDFRLACAIWWSIKALVRSKKWYRKAACCLYHGRDKLYLFPKNSGGHAFRCDEARP